MKLIKTIAGIGLALVALLFVSQAHAQVVPANLWRPNAASGTITPFNAALQIPCANIVGGCGGTLSGTSTAASFTTGTSSARSFLGNINDNLYIPNQAFLTTLGCPGFPSDHTLDTCIDDWYNNNSSTASSTNFYPAGGVYTWSDTSGFQFTNPGESASVTCLSGRGTRINDNAANGTLAVFANGTNANAGQGIYNCTAVGTTSGTVTNSSSSGLLGMVFGAPYTSAVGDFFTGFSADYDFINNGYIDTIDKSFFQNGGYEIYEPSFSNGGERITISNSTCSAPANSTTSNAMVLGGNSVVLSGDSLDGCGVTVQNGAHVEASGGHRETVNTALFGGYPIFTVQSGGVLDESEATYVQDGTGSNLASSFNVVQPGGILSEDKIAIYSGSGSTTPMFATGGGVATYNNMHNFGGVVTSSLTLFNVPASAGLTGNASGTLIYDTNHNLLSQGDGNSSGTIPETMYYTALATTTDVIKSANASGTDTAFATNYTLPANFLTSGKAIKVTAAWSETDPGTLTGETVKLQLRKAGSATTTLFSTITAVGFCASTQTCGYGAQFLITALTAPAMNASVTLACTTCNGGSAASVPFSRNTTAVPVSVDTTAPEILQFTTNFAGAANPATSSLILFQVDDIN